MTPTAYVRLFDTRRLKTELARGAIGSVALKVSHTALSLLLSIVLARVLSPEGYGIYAFAFSVMTLIAVPVQLGMPTLLVREIARYQYAESWGLLHGLLRWSTRAVLVISVAMGLVALLLASSLADRIDTTQLMTLGWAFALLPLIALNRLRAAALQGLRRVVLGQLPEKLVQPALLLVLLGVVILTSQLTPPLAMAAYVAAAAVSFVLGALMLYKGLPLPVRQSPPKYDTRVWLASTLPLSLLAGVQVISSQTDIFMLGLLTTKEQAGYYRVAVAGSSLVIFTLGALNEVLSPHFARLYSAGDLPRLQRIVTTASRINLLAAIPVAGAFILFGKPLLTFVVGSAYIPSYQPLAVLCVGQLLGAAMGPVGMLLNMTGHERYTLVGVGVASLLNIALNLALIPLFGAVGAAVANALAQVVWRAILCWAIAKHVGIGCTAFHGRGGEA